MDEQRCSVELCVECHQELTPPTVMLAGNRVHRQCFKEWAKRLRALGINHKTLMQVSMPDRSSETDEIKVITIRNVNQATITSLDGILTIQGRNIEADDNYHTFEELYEHRYALFLALCKRVFHDLTRDPNAPTPWCSKLHADGTMFEGHFIAGIGLEPGTEIAYHLPLRLFEETLQWCLYREHAPEYSGYTSHDVLKRLREL